MNLKAPMTPDSLRGVGIDFLVLDEFQDISEEAWTQCLRPTLASTGGHAIFIGTPKAYNQLYTVYMQGQDPKRSKLANGSHGSSQPLLPFIPESEIEAARADMDEKSFKQEFWLPSKPCLDVFITRLIVRNMSGNILLIQNCQSGSAWTLTSTQ